jgi:rare lipoprotein A
MWSRAALVATATVGLAACGGGTNVRPVGPVNGPASPSTSRSEVADPAPFVRGTLRPYVVRGRSYTPTIDEGYDRTGIASWYGDAFHGRPTATGEIYDMNGMSAAHTTLPLPSLAEVTNLATGQTIVVRVNDRGPFVGDRIIDLSRGAADALGVRSQGLAQVRVRYLGPAPRGGGTGPGIERARAAEDQVSPPSARTADSEPWFIQVGTFASRANAEALRRRLGATRTRVEETDVRGQPMYRVLIGPWPGRHEAERQRSALAGQGLLDAILVRAQ